LKVTKEQGFPEMMGSLDCMHWAWKNCPMAHHSQYIGNEKENILTLEVLKSYKLLIWNSFFGLLGELNDIDVSDCSGDSFFRWQVSYQLSNISQVTELLLI